MAHVEFKLGDYVEWRSQANGSAKTKSGTIVEVVKAGDLPVTRRIDTSCGGRNHESYVVEVPRFSKRSSGGLNPKPLKSALYWPRTSALRIVRRKASK